MHNNNDMQQGITVSEIASIVLVFVICWLTEYLWLSTLECITIGGYYQHACQCIALTLKLLHCCLPIRTFQY